MTKLLESNTVEIIKAVAELWKIILILVITIACLVLRKSIGRFLSRISKLKVAGQEIETIELTKEIKSVLTPDGSKTVLNEVTNSTESVAETNKTLENKTTTKSYFELLNIGKFTEAENLFLESQENNADPIKKAIEHLFFIYNKYAYGDPDALDELKQKINKSSNREVTTVGYRILGKIHYELTDYQKAIELYKTALQSENDETQVVEINAKIASSYYKLEDKKSSLQTLSDCTHKIKDEHALNRLYTHISDYYDNEKDYFKKAISLNKALTYNPANTKTLFALSYAFQEDNLHKLSYFYYKQTLSIDFNNEAALNNMAVALSELRDYSYYVHQQYKLAIEKGSTLSASNLANIYIHNGLFDEAESILNEAKKQKSIHANVWDSINSLNESKEAQKNKSKNLDKEILKIKLFFDNYTNRFFAPVSTIDFSLQNWKIENHSHTKIETSTNSLTFEFSDTESLTIIYESHNVGRVNYKRKDKKYPSTTLMEKLTGLFYINSSLDEITIMLQSEYIEYEVVYFKLQNNSQS